MANQPHESRTVTGRLTNLKGKPLGRLAVRAFRQDPGSADYPLGQAATTDRQGRYAITYSEKESGGGGTKGRGPNIFIRVFDGDAPLADSPVHRNAGPQITIDLTLDTEHRSTESTHAFRISGSVRSLDRRPIANATVRAADRGLNRSVTLSETRTGKDGRYDTGYDVGALLEPKKGTANLLVEVIGADHDIVASSEVRYNARRHEVVDLTVDSESKLSEWERVEGRLQSALRGTPLAELTEADLSFLEKSSQLTNEQVRARIGAARLTSASQLPEWFLYALLRQRLPQELGALLDTPETHIREALAAAQSARIVPTPSDREMSVIWKRVEALHTNHALDKPILDRRLKVREVLEVARLKPEKQRALAVALSTRNLESPNVWRSVQEETGLDEQLLDRVKFTLQTTTIADEHLPTVAAVQHDRRIHSVRDLAKHYDLESWEELVKETVASDDSDLPANLPGDTSEARRARFARQLYERTAAAYPTVAVAYGLSRRGEFAESPAAQMLPRIADMDEGFDLATVRLDAYLEDHASKLKISKSQHAVLNEDLKRVQRIYRLKPDTAVVATLLTDKLDSAAAILRTGRNDFLAKYGQDASFGRDTATAIYQQAETAAAKAFAFFSHFSPSFNTLRGPVLTGGCPAELKAIPHYAALFGTLDGCECEPCESVYSPAAYLTDLLAFLKTGIERDANHPNAGRVPANGLAAIESRTFCNGQDQLVLNRPRRPDIANTLLSCRNAETPLPYVDLVLEILENAVAPATGGVPQTTLEAGDLSAQPEHFIPAAYETLSKAIFPFSLPFDLFHEEESIYLEKLGTTREEMLETFFPFRLGDHAEFPNGDPHDLTEIRRWQSTDVAKARLGLLDTEWSLIASEPLSPPRFVSETWGFPPGNNNWWHPLRNVDTLLERSGLDFKDLLRLFHLKSFNPTGTIGIRDSDIGTCDPKRIELKGLDANALLYLSRFLRLQRTLGWSLREMDQALTSLSPEVALGRPALNGVFLVRLSHAILLKEAFGLPLDEVLVWWSPIDTADRSVPQLPHEPPVPSHYDRLFLSGRRGEAQFDAFQLNTERTELRTAGQLVDSQLATLSGAFGVPQSELTRLVNQTIGSGATLSLATISQFYRHTSLARALGLNVDDYLIVLDLIGLDPFAPAPLSPHETLDNTLQTLRFVHHVEALKASGFSIADLDYVLRQTMPFDDSPVAPTGQWIESGLATLRHGIALIDPFDGVREIISQVISVLGPGPTTTAEAGTLHALLLEALSVVTALGPDADTALLTTALNEAANLTVSGSAVNVQSLTTKLAAINGILDDLSATFIELSLRPQLAEDLALLLKTTTPISRVLLEQMPLPSNPAIRAGDALLAALRAPLPAGSSTPSFPTAVIELLYRLHKTALVVDKLNISAQELSHLFESGRPVGWLDLKSLPVQPGGPATPFDAWARLAELFRLRDALPLDRQEQLFELFDIAAQFHPGTTPHAGAERRAYIEQLQRLSGWSPDDVDALVGRRDFGEISHGAGGILQPRFPEHFADERLPLRVLTAVRFLKRLETTAFEVDGWMTHLPNQPAQVRVTRIRNALKARYGEDWPTVIKPVRDPLRERQRQALVTYLVHNWGLAGADDLFDHFLIDVEMSPCMMTSRLIQATASVQLFIQRVLMNLEPGLIMRDEAAEQWDWMKNYRVWEANRKIFLYPENWIVPELRDDKTPFFKELEREILQVDITNDTAEAALVHYLEKLHEVARLQVCGQYLETSNPLVLHIFARTREVPHQYYYRRGILDVDIASLRQLSNLENAFDAHWTPWERVDIDIEGDHLIPIVYNRRVYLFWPVFTSQDEAPLTRTLQSVLTLVGKLVQLQVQLGQLLQGIFKGLSVAVVAATTNSIVSLLEGFDTLTITGGLDIVNLEAATNGVRKIRTDLLAAFGIDNPEDLGDDTAEMIDAAHMPGIESIQTILNDISSLVTTYEDYLFSFLPAKRLEVQMAWSEYRHDTWSAKKTSSGVVSFRDVISMLFENLPKVPGFGRNGVRRLFTFRAAVDQNNQLTVRCAVALPASLLDEATYTTLLDTSISGPLDPATGRPTWLTAPVEIGHFRFNTCAGQLDAVDTSEHIGFVAIFSQAANQILDMGQTALQTLRGDRQLQQSGVPVTPDDDPIRPSRLRRLLDQIPLPRHFLPPFGTQDLDTYRVLARHQSTSLLEKLFGFFYQDASRTFFCFPWMLPTKDVEKSRPGFVFFPFYHPYTCALLENIQRAGVAGVYEDRYVLDADGRAVPAVEQTSLPLQLLLQDDNFFSPPEYNPVDVVYNSPNGPRTIRPIEEFNFSTIGAYSQYNWEFFFHVPLLIASRLSTNQKFREAQRWFHYIFNPTDHSRGQVPEKFWRTRPFVERPAGDYAVQHIDELLELLNAEAEQPGLQELEWAVRRWRRDAFNPHLVARTRTTAFQKTVVMKYIDNLVAWGDSLFRRETREAVNEATQLYILAAKLLGPRPRRIPKTSVRSERTFRQLEANLDAFSNALVTFENYLPSNGAGLGVGRLGGGALGRDYVRRDRATMAPVDWAWRDLTMSPSMQNVASHSKVSDGLYFCVPPNDKLLAKWDLVADRLFKIRHCQNIEGGVLQLPLLSLPIDPAILVRAQAMGVDIQDVLNQLPMPLPHYRFHILLQKATELCGELRSLGSALLSALEKRDGEALALLRNTQEQKLLAAVQAIKEKHIDESQLAVENLKRSKEVASMKQSHYRQLFAEFMNPEEVIHGVLGSLSVLLQIYQTGIKWGAVPASLIPNIKGGFPTTLGVTYGGNNTGDAASRASDAVGALASTISSVGSLISTMGGYRRRAADWLLQASLASKELEGLDRQIAAAEVRVAIAESELENHKLQISNNRDIQSFMQDKFTNEELYDWMVSEVSSLHFQTYQMAYELARQSEFALAIELGVERPGIVRADHWDSLKKGLLAGEHLYHDLKGLDTAYLNGNVREYEMTKHISLRQVDPLALLELRTTGRCFVTLPEALFDMDGPGHYFRRIKSVALSIPCITGPYAGVNCTLTLLRSGIRRNAALVGGTYAPQDTDTDRFQSIVASSAQNDSGLLETNLRDERYLPFEYAGVISEWQLELPSNSETNLPRQFDYDTISDVILHMRFTARDGGSLLRTASATHLKTMIEQATAAGSVQLFSLRHDFPTEWSRFQTLTPDVNKRFEMKVGLRPEHFPFWSQGRLNRVVRVEIFARAATSTLPPGIEIFDKSDKTDITAKKESPVSNSPIAGLLAWTLNGGTAGIAPPTNPIGEFSLFFETRTFADMWIAITWGA